ncbi:PREDICTED: endothelin-converting enzyme 1 [Nicrophorus vespilloides]|uniref:Endothelin-converting enzyme 1 n=1 Tax=Nicrophorus vespilloides TaxID=110193 RepID=A0ABM1MDW3_NICVS|nr:PREDICTED: endothelin-converting enzyme 1 [Nicrophorus vespilloides]
MLQVSAPNGSSPDEKKCGGRSGGAYRWVEEEWLFNGADRLGVLQDRQTPLSNPESWIQDLITGGTITSDSSLRLPVLVLLAVNLLLVLVAAIVLVGVTVWSKNENLCLTEQCVNTASRVLRAMDRSADPCKDFYQYACGGWMKANPVPDWTATWDRLALLRESLLQDMRQLLESGSGDGGKEPSGIRKARVLYRTCMDTDALESKGLEPIKDILKIVGLTSSPPNATAASGFDWLFTVARARRVLGLNVLYGLNVAEDVRNSSLHKIVIEQVSPGFGERYLLQPSRFRQEIKNYKNHVASMMNAYTNSTDGHAFAEEIVAFGTEIAKVMTPAEKRRSTGHLFHEVTLEELSRGPGQDNISWKSVNWTRYMSIVFNETNVSLNSSKDKAILLDLGYMQKLTTLLLRTDPYIIERFIWWNVFSTVAPLTLAKFRSLGFEFSQKLLGLQARTPRWKGCTGNVNSNFGLALSYLYVQSQFRKGYRDKALVMLDDIRAAFEDAVHEQDWMDDITRERTLTKLHAIRAFVGYPGWIMNATQLDIHYKKANVIEGELFKTYLNLTSSAVRRNLESIRRRPNRNRWVAAATTVNAFYSATLNSVTFPAGILKPPFYSNGIEAIDYGAIGAIMGHEITHGFDDQGRRYDENGNLKQWWSLSTLDHYHSRVQCIIDQYNNYTMPGLGASFNVQGFNTQGENIADNGGLRAAFEGYRRRQDRSEGGSMRQRLPGLSDITTDQLFFLGFAQIWCGNSTVGALKSKLVDGVHSPNRIRVVGTLSNSKEFADAWGCPAGTPMNPPDKCVLW